jgi:carbamoyl-phosphate synthase large subunit
MVAPLNILLTSVGRRGELVRSFRAAYQRLGIDGRILATDADWLAPAAHLVDRCFVVPPTHTPEFPQVIRKICAEHDVRLVLPLIDPDIPVLSRLAPDLVSILTIVGVVGQQAAAIGADKWQTSRFFAELGLATPRTWQGDAPPTLPEFPLFVKPTNGSAAVNTFRVTDRQQLDFFRQYVPNCLIQEFIQGTEITTDVLCDFDGHFITLVSRQRIAVRGGEAIKSVTVHHPEISAACRKIAENLPARGPITVQCILRDDRPIFTEINSRLGGGLPLAVAAGVDIPGMLLALANHQPVDHWNKEYADKIYMTRFDESLFLRTSDCEKMDRSYL